MEFRSDFETADLGFELSWEAVNDSGCVQQHTLTFEGQEGVLQSLNYPISYLNDQGCWTTITAPVGMRIWLEFDQFELSRKERNCSDFLELYTNSAKRNPHRLCAAAGNDVFLLKFLSQDNYTSVYFYTDDFDNGAGYKATYRAGQYNS